MLLALASFFEFFFSVVACSLIFGSLVWLFAIVAFPIKLGND